MAPESFDKDRDAFFKALPRAQRARLLVKGFSAVGARAPRGLLVFIGQLFAAAPAAMGALSVALLAGAAGYWISLDPGSALARAGAQWGISWGAVGAVGEALGPRVLLVILWLAGAHVAGDIKKQARALKEAPGGARKGALKTAWSAAGAVAKGYGAGLRVRALRRALPNQASLIAYERAAIGGVAKRAAPAAPRSSRRL